jgi:hypothetical protein
VAAVVRDGSSRVVLLAHPPDPRASDVDGRGSCDEFNTWRGGRLVHKSRLMIRGMRTPLADGCRREVPGNCSGLGHKQRGIRCPHVSVRESGGESSERIAHGAGSGGAAPDVHASDAERERTLALLRDAALAGRLGFEELADRIVLDLRDQWGDARPPLFGSRTSPRARRSARGRSHRRGPGSSFSRWGPCPGRLPSPSRPCGRPAQTTATELPSHAVGGSLILFAGSVTCPRSRLRRPVGSSR